MGLWKKLGHLSFWISQIFDLADFLLMVLFNMFLLCAPYFLPPGTDVWGKTFCKKLFGRTVSPWSDPCYLNMTLCLAQKMLIRNVEQNLSLKLYLWFSQRDSSKSLVVHLQGKTEWKYRAFVAKVNTVPSRSGEQPSYCCAVLSCSVMSNSLWPHEL